MGETARPIRSFSTLGCPDLELDAVLAVARRFRIDTVELRALGGTRDLPAYFSRTYGSPKGLAEALSDRPPVIGLGTGFNLMVNGSEDRQILIDYAIWGEAAGVPRLRVFDGGVEGSDAEIHHACETLAWWQRTKAERGWTIDLMMETHDAFAQTGPLARFLKAAPECLLLWDAHHTWRKGGEDPIKTWELVRPQTCHIHVKDSLSVPSPGFPYTYVVPGAGEFPMERLRTRLSRDGYAGVLSLEWEKLFHPYLPSIETALQEAQDRGWW